MKRRSLSQKVTRIQCVLLAAIIIAVACPRSGHAQSPESTKEVVRQMVEAINERDFDALDELIAPDVRRQSAATPNVEVRDRQQFKDFLHQDLAAFPDAQQDILTMVAENDLVAVRMLYRGTQTGPMGPFPPSGKKVEIPFLGFLRVEDGRIAEIWVEWDNLSALTQLGHFPPAEDPTDRLHDNAAAADSPPE